MFAPPLPVKSENLLRRLTADCFKKIPVFVIMKIYVIKIAVHGVSPMVWRRLRIAADTSLAALHFIFQIV
ncbi:IS1096 element passenger TnpR family protein, partial [Klebsiella pneumoniae]|uniref:IS1096 element passenger TnpR family protein n=1 Tax=Klebsiella pneumoniae TaxID=573 RepID=UPI003A4E42F7